MDQHRADDREWLQTNRAGSYAMGAADRVPRRKYHSLLTVRDPGRGEPWNVLAEVGEELIIGGKTHRLLELDFGAAPSSDATRMSQTFEWWPLPCVHYRIGKVSLSRCLRLDPDRDVVHLHYRITGAEEGLEMRLMPFLLCRSWHDLAQENPYLNGAVERRGAGAELTAVLMQPYAPMPQIELALSAPGGDFDVSGDWYRGIRYACETERGYDAVEDFFTPGAFTLHVDGEAEFCLSIGLADDERPVSACGPAAKSPLVEPADAGAEGEDARPGAPGFHEALQHAADQFLLRLRDGTQGVVAGYPWFGEWGRDTLISLPGLCLARGRYADAVALLRGLAARRVRGLVANLPASGDLPANTNSIDASLLFVRAVRLLAEQAGSEEAEPLMPVVCEILDALAAGADPRIELTAEMGLSVAPGPWALTWMDAVIDGQPVTPRHGHAVEVDAMLLEAVHFAVAWARTNSRKFAECWGPRLKGAEEVFLRRFWSEDSGYLADTNRDGVPEFRLRPNQLLALASPLCPLTRAQACRALDAVRSCLLTPVGVRTLSPDDPDYQGRYRGDQASRDRAYHQGTVWPWLLGPYADSLLRLEPGPAAIQELQTILAALQTHLASEACLGQISEVFDGTFPHRPGGTPAQAWSVAEVVRIEKLVGGAS